jgi:PAS domain S-box-containing protein
MRVGELARRTGVGVSTLRAWEQRFGLLEPERTSGGQRLYAERDVARVSAVRRLVGEGLTLSAAVARVSNSGSAVLPTGEGEELFLRQVLEAADEGIWVSREGRTRYANRRAAHLVGCSIDELLARPVLDFICPEYEPLVREKGELGRAGSRQRYEVEMRRLDGSTFTASCSTSPLHDRAGRYQGAVAIIRDVTERNEAESRSRLRAEMLDAVGEAVAAARPDGTMLYMNPAAERLFGWRSSEIVGKEGLKLLGPPEVADEAARVHESLVAGKHFAGDLLLMRRDGTKIRAHMTSSPVLDESGNVVALIAIYRHRAEQIKIDREVRLRNLQMETVAVLGAQVLTGVDAETILGEVVDAARRVLEADRSAVLEVLTDATELQLQAASPSVDDRPVVPAGSRSLAGYAALARKVVHVDDAARERRFDLGPGGASPGSAIAAPVFGPDGVRAVLTAESAAAHHFDASAVDFMQALANVVGVALG